MRVVLTVGASCPINSTSDPIWGSATWVVCPFAKEVFGFCVDATARGIVDDGHGICYLFECLECNRKTSPRSQRSLRKQCQRA